MSIIEKALAKAADKQAQPRPLTMPENQAQISETSPAVPAPSFFTQAADVSPGTEAQTERPDTFHQIGWEALRSKGMLVPDMARSQLAEEYRLIKRPLLMNAFPEGDNGIERANLILVTSSVPGEGKTFTAVNLALSIAMELDKTVLLVDADVAKPSISKLLGISERAGLIDLLEGKTLRVADVLLKTDIPNLRVLPAGRLHQHSTELLASAAMRRLAKELSERYHDRIVVFDSPPLLAATQGSVLATLVGQVVLVIESEVTPQYIVQESVAKLETCKVVGTVLNKTKKGFGFTHYGYGYGHGYGEYGHQ